MNTFMTLADIDAAIPHDNTRPGLPGPLEILGRRTLHQLIHRPFNPMQCHVELGCAVTTLEVTGFSLLGLSNAKQVIVKAKAVRTLAADPLVVERQLPLSWLVGVDGKLLGIDGLSAIATAIELAEQIGEDWTKWSTTTAVNVIVHHLPRLQALVEAKAQVKVEAPTPAKTKPKGLSKGARKALRRQKALARAEATQTKPVHVPPPATVAEPVVKFVPGKVVTKDGIAHVVCTGRYGNCLKLTPFDNALVAKSLGSVMHALRIRRYSEISVENLPSVSFCADCALAILAAWQTIPEALANRDRKIAEAERYQAEQKTARDAEAEAKRQAVDRQRQTELLRRQKAMRARTGGAFGKKQVSWMNSR